MQVAAGESVLEVRHERGCFEYKKACTYCACLAER